jgi:hypothetical protein
MRQDHAVSIRGQSGLRNDPYEKVPTARLNLKR